VTLPATTGHAMLPQNVVLVMLQKMGTGAQIRRGLSPAHNLMPVLVLLEICLNIFVIPQIQQLKAVTKQKDTVKPAQKATHADCVLLAEKNTVVFRVNGNAAHVCHLLTIECGSVWRCFASPLFCVVLLVLKWCMKTLMKPSATILKKL
jgi:hypothetical protein